MAVVSELQVIIDGDSSRLVKALAQSSVATKAFGSSVASSTATAQSKMTATASTARSALGTILPVSAAAAGLAFVGVAKASIQASLQMDDAFTRIRSLSTASAEDVEAWRGQVMELAGETAQAPQELADALYFLSSAGLEASQVMPALETSAKAAATGLGSTADVANIVASAMNAYSDSGLEAVEVTDTLVAAVKAGRAEPDAFATALGRVLPIASQAGVEFTDLTASLSALSNIGLDVNEGVTAIRGALQAIVAPGSQAADALSDLGLTAQDMLDAIDERGLFGALQMLDGAARRNTNSQAEYIGVLRKVIPNVRALTGVLGLNSQEAAKVDAIFQDVRDSVGETGKAFDTTAESSGFKLRQAMVELQTIMIEFGDAILPTVVTVAGAVADVLGKVAENARETFDWLGAIADRLPDLTPDEPPEVDSWLPSVDDFKRWGSEAVAGFTSNWGDVGRWLDETGSKFRRALTGIPPDADDAAASLDNLAGRHDDVATAADAAAYQESVFTEAVKEARKEQQKLRIDEDALIASLQGLSAIGLDVNDWLADFRAELEESEDPQATFAEGLAEIKSAAKDWRTEVAGQITGVSDVLGDLADQTSWTVSEVSGAFQDAAEDARNFAADLATIGETGGQTGRDLASALLEMGPDAAGFANFIATASDDMRRQMVEDFGLVLSAGKSGASDLQKALVPVLTDIRSILEDIAKVWGITIKTNKDTATRDITDIKADLLELTGRSWNIDVILHTMAGSPWPDEALKTRLIDPMKAMGFVRKAEGWVLRADIEVHTAQKVVDRTPRLTEIMPHHDWMRILERQDQPRIPRVVFQPAKNREAERDRDRRLVVALDRRRFSDELTYDATYRGW